MVAESTPIILGSAAIFADGQRAKLIALEVDESWEVLNVIVSRGFMRWAERVKLPFTASSTWSESAVEFSCTSVEAFARELPPVAAPARPVDNETPVALTTGRVIGALVNGPTRRVTAMIVQSGSRRLRVPAADVSFEGKVLHVTTPVETLSEHRPDAEIAHEVWHRLRRDNVIMPDEIQLIEVDSVGGVVTVAGNVRRKGTRERAEALAAGVPGIVRLENRVMDDLQLETNLGWALERAGVQRSASIHGRSSLGDVVLYGHAPSRQAVEDATRVTSALDGVRDVKSRVQVGSSRPVAVA